MNVISGLGSFKSFNKLKREYGGKNILLVTGKESFSTCGAREFLNSELKNEKITHFSNFRVNPKIEDALRGVKVAIQSQVEVIIAVGGGSVIDMAKLIKAFLKSPDKSYQITRGKIEMLDPKIPLIAVPTTAGSGSEATHFAVAYIGSNKYSLASQLLLPDHVILDGFLTKSGSNYLKACNGLDALSQAIESSWALGSTDQSRLLALEAVRLCVKNLNNVANNHYKESELQEILDAAHLAGKAINISKTTAAHAWSYAFTSQYGIPHGHAVWLTLPHIFNVHLEAEKTKLMDPSSYKTFKNVMNELLELLPIKNPNTAVTDLKQYLSQIKIETDFSKLGLDKREKRAEISQKVNSERLKNNPAILNQFDISKIFEL